MRCSDYIGWIALKLEGTLSPDREHELEGHLAACPRCRAELLLQKKIGESLIEEAPSRLSPDFTQRVSSRALATVRLERRLRTVRRLVPALVYSVGVVFLLIFRAQIAQLMAAMSAEVAEATNQAGTRLASVLTGMFPASLDISAESHPLLTTLNQLLTNTLVAAGLACGLVVWAFSRVLTFMRD
jgi:anti-sigma factor RsiW